MIDNPDSVQDPENIIMTHFGVSVDEYFKTHHVIAEEDLLCPPVVGDSFCFNNFQNRINAYLEGEIIWRGLYKDGKFNRCYYSYYVKISQVSEADLENNLFEEVDFSRLNTSNRIAAFDVARKMMLNKGFYMENKFEKEAARALGASLEYLTKRKSITKDNLIELWKEPEKFFAEIREDEEMTYGLTSIYQLLDGRIVDNFYCIVDMIREIIGEN